MGDVRVVPQKAAAVAELEFDDAKPKQQENSNYIDNNSKAIQWVYCIIALHHDIGLPTDSDG